MAACEGLGTRLAALEAAQTTDSCGLTYKFSHQTNSTDAEVVFSLPLAPETTAMIEFEVLALQQDGLGRAGFKRIGLFFRRSSSVQEEQFWHTIVTVPSSRDFSVAYLLQAESIDFTVKSASLGPTDWAGCLHVSSLGG